MTESELLREVNDIEQLPLEDRPAELMRLHDRLRSRLEGGDALSHGG